MKRSGPLKRTPLKQRSDKRANLMREDRVPLITSLVEAGFGCEVGPVFEYYGHPAARYCTGKIEGLHELRKRSSGGSLTNRANLVPSCNRCNSEIENIPIEAHEWGLVVREGDPQWDSLGTKKD